MVVLVIWVVFVVVVVKMMMIVAVNRDNCGWGWDGNGCPEGKTWNDSMGVFQPTVQCTLTNQITLEHNLLSKILFRNGANSRHIFFAPLDTAAIFLHFCFGTLLRYFSSHAPLARRRGAPNSGKNAQHVNFTHKYPGTKRTDKKIMVLYHGVI